MNQTRAARVVCTVCNRSTKDEFQAKLKHMVRFHPDIVVEKIVPMIVNPVDAQLKGAQLAEAIMRGVREYAN